MKTEPNKERDFWKKVGVVTGGTVLSHGLLFLASPLIALLYEPSEFGAYMMYVACLSIMAIIGTLRYEVPITITKTAKQAKGLVALVMIFATGTALLLLLTAWIADSSLLARLFANSNTSYIVLLLISGCIAEGCLRPFRAWNIRIHNLSALAFSKPLQSIGLIVVQTAMYAFGSIGLIVGDLCGRILAVATHWFSARSKGQSPISFSTARSLKLVAIKYRRFPLFSTWGTLSNQLVDCGPILILGALYFPAIAGSFAMAHRALIGSFIVLSHSITQVYNAEASKAIRESPDQLKLLFWQTSLRLALLGFVPILSLAFMGPTIFQWFFSEQWQLAGKFMTLLAPAAIGQILVGPIYQTLDLLQKQKWAFFLNLSGLFGVLAVFALAYRTGMSPSGCVRLYSGWVFVYNAGLYISAVTAIRQHHLKLECNSLCEPLMSGPKLATPKAA